MPYNTRRVSLSLPSLGIQLPGTNSSSRASQHHNHYSSSSNNVKSPVAAAAAASPATTTATKSASAATTAAASKKISSSESPPAAKRVKRSHTLNSIKESPTASSAPPAKSPISLPSRSRKPSMQLKQHQQSQQQLQQQRLALLGTPPPSPRPLESSSKLDFQGINDDVVVAVLHQLESTGNRPHLIKELAAVLVTTLKTVESSQNPVAIISSRLTNYLKRPWTALAPCPLTKEQVTVHPRRVYYYLTTMPRQEIPEYADTPITGRHVISPSISSGPDEEEDVHSRMMDLRSPSPEVHLSALDEADDFDSISAMNGMTFSEATYRDVSHLPHSSSRLASPPLEYDEREFTQTASVMQQRKRSEQAERELRQQLLEQQLQQRQESAAASDQSSQDGDTMLSPKDTDNENDPADENEVKQDLSDAVDLPTHSERDDLNNYNESSISFIFGQSNQHLYPQIYMNSPVIRPQVLQGTLSINTSSPLTSKKAPSLVEIGPGAIYDLEVQHNDMLDAFGAWGDLKSPENVELAELDDMFGGY